MKCGHVDCNKKATEFRCDGCYLHDTFSESGDYPCRGCKEPEKKKPVILDNNPISIAKHMEEHPEFAKKLKER